jgi:hypothetical protein
MTSNSTSTTTTTTTIKARSQGNQLGRVVAWPKQQQHNKKQKYGNIRLKPFLHAKIYNLKLYPFLAF